MKTPRTPDVSLFIKYRVRKYNKSVKYKGVTDLFRKEIYQILLLNKHHLCEWQRVVEGGGGEKAVWNFIDNKIGFRKIVFCKFRTSDMEESSARSFPWD